MKQQIEVRDILKEIPKTLNSCMEDYNRKFRKELEDKGKLKKWYKLIGVVLVQMSQMNWKVRENMLL